MDNTKNLIFPAIVFGVIVGLFIFISILVDSEMTGNVVELGNKRVVTKIVDGDTIIVEGGEKIRLLAVDCDERGKECYTIAKNWLEEILLGKEVLLESDSEEKDRYGRSLRFIFLDGENINVRLVKEGYCIARFETEQSKYKTEIQQAEQEAIKNKIGCKWKDS